MFRNFQFQDFILNYQIEFKCDARGNDLIANQYAISKSG